MTSDPHTLDEYYQEVASRESATLWDIKRAIWGDATGRDATVLALRELEAQGRIVRKECRYHVVGAVAAKPPIYLNGSELTGAVAAEQQVAEMADPSIVFPGRGPYFADPPEVARLENSETRPAAIERVEPRMSIEVPEHHDDEDHGVQSEVERAAPREATPDPAPLVSAVNRAAGAVADALLGVSEYPDAILAEAAVFAKRAAKALEIARQDLVRAEAAEKAAAEAHCTAASAVLAAAQRVARLEQIAGLP